MSLGVNSLNESLSQRTYPLQNAFGSHSENILPTDQKSSPKKPQLFINGNNDKENISSFNNAFRTDRQKDENSKTSSISEDNSGNLQQSNSQSRREDTSNPTDRDDLESTPPTSESQINDSEDQKPKGTLLDKLKEAIDFKKKTHIEFSRKIKEKALKENIKKAYEELLKYQEARGNVQLTEENFYGETFLKPYIQYISCLFEEALQTFLLLKNKYEESERLEKKLSLNPVDIGFLYHLTGTCLSQLGYKEGGDDLLKAKKLFEEYNEQQTKLPEESRDKRPYVLAHCLSSLGQHYLQNRSLTEARTCFDQALDMMSKLEKEEEYARPSKSFFIAWSYIDLAELEIAEEHYDQAKMDLDQAAELLKVGRSEDYYIRGKVERNLGQVCLGKKHYSQAKKHYEEALKILDFTLAPGNYYSKQYYKELQLIPEETA